MALAQKEKTDVAYSRPNGLAHVREMPLALALSAVLVWIAQFHHFREFGLYEDDYWFISEAMGKDLSYLGGRLHTAFTTLPQGRPFGFFLPDFFSFVGDKLGGLPAIYLLGFAIVTLNTFLCYRLLRTRVPVAPAAVGAAVFCLFPADTTKILLTHDFQLQPSLTFALLASLAYGTSPFLPKGVSSEVDSVTTPPRRGPLWGGQSGRQLLAYLLAAGALLSYESGFLALFALPLFVRPWDRSTPRILAKHGAALIGVLAVVVLARFAVGEGRATESVGGVTAIVPPLLGSLVLGPIRSLAAMFYGPLKAIPGWDAETLAAALVTLVACGALLFTAGRAARRVASRGQSTSATGDVPRREVLQVGAAGLAMLVLGYGLAFTHFPPNAIVGRGTSVHLGATLGMSVLAAAVAWLLLAIRPRLAAVLIAAYLAVAVGYYVTIERDFMRSWQLQRAFWQQVVSCCSDLQDGTILLYELNPSDEPTFIFTNSWTDPLILGETFAFPPGWSNPPRLFGLTQWLDRVQPNGDHLVWWVPGASWDEHWEVLPQDNVILLRRAPDGGLTRITGTVDVAGQSLELKPPAASVAWPPAQLYAPLLGP